MFNGSPLRRMARVATAQYFWFLIKQGKREVSCGSLEQAMARFRAAQKIAGKLVGLDEQNPKWQRDLSVSHNYVGNVLIARGDGPGASTVIRPLSVLM